MQSLVGMSAYDSEAMLIGKVEQIGLRKVGGGGNAHITIKIGEKESTLGWHLKNRRHSSAQSS